MQTVRLIILGFGSVSRELCKIIERKTEILRNKFKLKFCVVGVTDSSGGLYCSRGLSLPELVSFKLENGRIKTFKPNTEYHQVDSSFELASKFEYDILIDASPAALQDGIDGEAIRCIISAFCKKSHVVLANKTSLVLDYTRIVETARENNVNLRFSATVCGGLPVFNVGSRDLKCAKFNRIYGVLNGTSNFVLTEVMKGTTLDTAITEAQSRGIAEANPELDCSIIYLFTFLVNGTDAANKLVIIANSILEVSPAISLSDVKIQGINAEILSNLKKSEAKGKVLKLVAAAELLEDGKYIFSVAPRLVQKESFIGQTDNTDKCCIFESDLFETIYLRTNENGVVPTSAAILRDLIDVCLD